MTEETDDILAAEYALGLLAQDELSQAHARATTDRLFARRIVMWQEYLSKLANLEPVAPPAAVKKAVIARVFPDEKPKSIWQRVRVWQALAGSAIAVMALVVFVSVQFEPPKNTGPLYTAEIVSEAGDFRVIAVVDKSRNEIILTRTAGGAPEGRILQVWAHGPDEPAQSVGLWPAGETVRLALPTEIAAVRGTLTVGVSEEPPGGSPTGSPSGRVFGTVDILNVSQDAG